MRILFLIIFVSKFVPAAAQDLEKKIFYSESKSLVVALTSFNHFTLKHTEKKGRFVFEYSNHADELKPVYTDENGMVEIKIMPKADLLPGSQKNKYRAGQPQFPNYQLEIPENIDIKIVYTNGDFSVADFTGNLELYLEHGDLDLQNINGSLRIQSFDGVINCQIQDARLSIESNNGKVETVLDSNTLDISESRVAGIYGKPHNSIVIKTVNGKIRLSKQADK